MLKRKQILGTLALATLVTTTLGVASLTASADAANNTPTTVGFSLKGGASVRISDSDNITGMRYMISMPTSEHTALESNATYEVSYGILIAPSFYQTAYGELNADNVFGASPKYDWAVEQADGSFVYSGKNGAVVEGVQTPYRIINVSTDKLTVDKKDATKSVFYGCLYEVLDENIAEEFVGVGYMKYSYESEGTTKTEYKFVTSAENERSMAYVAQKAYADTTSADRLTDPQKATIKTRYLDKVANVEKPYIVENYDAATGTLINTEDATGKLGTPAEIGDKAIDGYVFDADNANNVLQGTVWADGSLVLKRYYKTESNVYLTYQNFKDDVNVAYTYTEQPNWNGGNRMQKAVNVMSVAVADLPSDVASGVSEYGGALKILSDGVLNGATTYYSWKNIEITDTVRTYTDNVQLPQTYLDNVPDTDYKAISFRVYVVPTEGATATWGVYTTSGTTASQKNLVEGWQTLYLSKSDFDSIATENTTAAKIRLPMGIFSGVSDLYIAYIGYELGATHNVNVVDTVAVETTKKSFDWSIQTTVAAPTKEGYTFVGYSLDETGENTVSDITLVPTGGTVYAQYLQGNILNALNEVQDIGVDTMNYHYSWNDTERISTNTNVMFKSKSEIPETIASGMSVGSQGMLHVIQDTNVGQTADQFHSRGRSIWFRAGLVTLPETYEKVLLRVYIEADEGKTAKHFVFTNGSATNYDTTQTVIGENMTTGWYTLEISKDLVEKQMQSDYFGIGHFNNVKNLYIDYIAYV